MEARLRQALARAEEVARLLADPETARNPAKLKLLGREHARLDAIRLIHDRLARLRAELDQAQELVADPDPEISQLARQDGERLRPEIARLEAQLGELLAPPDPLDDRDSIVEIRAGTGGDEAALFAADLFRMYTRFCERRGWKVELLDLSQGVLGGLKEAIFAARGPRAYGTLRYESGVHRVQRVPATEAQGRIHTSAATVAVLPEAEEVDVKIEEKDLRIDVFHRQRRADHAPADRSRRAMPGPEIPAAKQDPGAGDPALAAARPDDRRAGGRARSCAARPSGDG